MKIGVWSDAELWTQDGFSIRRRWLEGPEMVPSCPGMAEVGAAGKEDPWSHPVWLVAAV
jgi:hypothetical protein